VKNGLETDVDCGGGTCPACASGKVCKASTDCKPGICSSGKCRPGASCKEILAAHKGSKSGTYTIDPDGSGSTYKAFSVHCDMTTSGGGWTGVTTTLAKNNFVSKLTGYNTLGKYCNFSGDKPQKLGGGSGRYLCRYDMKLGFSFTEVRVSKVKVAAIITSKTNSTVDVHYLYRAWGTIACQGCHGDFRFGTSVASISQILSFSNTYLGLGQCKYKSSWGTKGKVVTWDNKKKTVKAGSTLRLEFGEDCGGEGWQWAGGTVYVR